MKENKLRMWMFSLLLFIGLLYCIDGKDIRSNEVLLTAKLQNDSDSDSETDVLTRGKDLVDEALIPVYDMTNFFLEDIVQQNDLNYMAERGVDFSDLDAIVDSFEDDYEEWLEYGIGYSVCATIGVVLLLFMTLGGLIICCCRTCCGNCGGKIDPREASNAGCKRGCCGFFLFIVITVVLLGSLAMFFTAVRVHDELHSDEDVFHSIADGMDTMGVYVNNTLDELENGTLGVYNDTVDRVFYIMDNLVTDAYTALDNEAGISENMNPLLDFSSQMYPLNDTLQDVQNNATELQGDVDALTTDLENLKQQIIAELESNSCGVDYCTLMSHRVGNTTVVVNYTNIQNGYDLLIGGLNEALRRGLYDILSEGYGDFKSIVGEVNDTVNEEIRRAREAADDVAGTITEELDNVRGDIGEVDFTGVGNDLREVSEDDMELPAYITFWSLVGLASVLALIVLLTYLGLLFSCCPRANEENDYCCTRKMGATCLLAGVGITFICFWLFLLVLLPMFLAGGLTHTEICRHVVALDESPISGIIDELVNASFAEDVGFSISITDIYTSCKENQAFYTALDAEKTFDFNLTELLDTSTIDQEIDKIQDMNIVISNIEILSNNTAQFLFLFGGQLSQASNNTQGYLSELQKDVTSENLKELADALRVLAANETLPILETLANELEGLYNTNVTGIDGQRKATYAQLADAQETMTSADVTQITVGLLAGQNYTNSEGEELIEQVIDDKTSRVEEQIDSAVNSIDDNVRHNIGQCKPVYNAVATIVDSACVELLYALNGYWFALGWSIFFLLISIILSFKLSTMYRKTMDHDEIIPEERSARRTPRHQNNDSTVLIVRTNSHEMTPVNNPVYSVNDHYSYQKIPRPQLKPGVAVYPQETTPFVGRPPSYSKSQFV